MATSSCNLFATILSFSIVISLFCKTAVSQSIIKSLPGFDGNLPFFLETGYIGVGKMEEVQLFYYFVESERSPENDPLMLWLTGGPGCSAFSGLVYEVGPLKFNYVDSKHNKPVFELNPYSWTKVANIIFLDSPVGTGFSYAKTGEAYHVNDTIAAAEIYDFLRKWLVSNPQFLANPLYIGGDSYSGIIVPIVVQEILNGNEMGLQPPMDLRGYLLGNPLTNYRIDLNSKISFAYRLSLLSKKIYESFKINCKGEYAYPDPNNALCMQDIQTINECIKKLDPAQILEPECSRTFSPNPMASRWDPTAISDYSIDDDILLSPSQIPERWCREYNYLYSYTWANDKNVQEALRIREGTIKEWARCNYSLSYSYGVISTIDYHKNFTKTGLQALIYSGDHDMAIPHVGTEEWIESLNLTIASDWQPWLVDGQVAGYTVEYSYDEYAYRLTFATVKGGGHTAPEYKPKQCLAMVDRWFAIYPL
ncbi:serine carboxypeptidase, putative [Ricinus communis]|uniref:Serine carboxypeptidase, putative n=1 Tax=Ricinus communis TaxID=3988 RepID=B9S819_RICCO|nr:serine carboxypeptidase, putative [Ricinus communis]